MARFGHLRTVPGVTPAVDYPWAVLLAAIESLLLLPGFRRGIQFFDEGSQLRMAQQALGDLHGQRLPHPYLGFDLFYALWFRVFPLRIETLRTEILLVSVLSIFVFVLLGRSVLSRAQTGAVTAIYFAWQWIFQPFAYYSREANLCALLAGFLIIRWIQRGRPGALVASGFVLAWSVAFKFNVGLLATVGLLIFLLLDRADHWKKAVLLWAVSFSGTLFGLIGISLLLHRQTEFFLNLLRMPISYTQALFFPAPAVLWLLLLPGLIVGGHLWRQVDRANATWRTLLLLVLWLPFSLAQDFPRHWLAHLLWVPLPFWILGARAHALVWKNRRFQNVLGLTVTLGLCAYGLWTFQPWRVLSEKTVFLDHSRAQVRVSQQEYDALTQIINRVSELTTVDEPIFVFPTQPLLYFLTDRENSTAYDNLHGGWRWEKDVIHQLQSNPPKLVLAVPGRGVWNLIGVEQAPQVWAWLEEHYPKIYGTWKISGLGSLQIRVSASAEIGI